MKSKIPTMLLLLLLILAFPCAHTAKKKSSRSAPAAASTPSTMTDAQRIAEATRRQATGVTMANSDRVAEAIKEFQASANLLEGLVSCRDQLTRAISRRS